jgi:hypothetical protein
MLAAQPRTESIAMTEWDRAEAEMAIALKRAELNRALSYRTRYNAEGHNICLALINFKDGSSDVLTAYSHDSAIPESIRLGLNLVPDVSAFVPASARFGCAGMGQYHTEPKLLNFLAATPAIRQRVYTGPLPEDPLYRRVLEKQREQAARQAQRLKRPEDIASVTLVTEIDCCTTCTDYSLQRFRARFPHTPLHVIELGKKVREKVPAQFRHVKVTVT